MSFVFVPGLKYESGLSFCQGQGFGVIQGNDKCLKFDPSVFSDASLLRLNSILIYTLVILVLTAAVENTYSSELSR